jgi:archaellum component FlaD/FlaE
MESPGTADGGTTDDAEQRDSPIAPTKADSDNVHDENARNNNTEREEVKVLGGEEEEKEEEEDDDDDDDDDNEDEDEEDEEEDEEPRLKYAYLTRHLPSLYRNGDATSTFLVGGDKMVVLRPLKPDYVLSSS